MNILLIHNFYRTKGGEDVAVICQRELLEQANHTVIDYFAYSNTLREKNIFQRFTSLISIFSFKSYQQLTYLIGDKKIDVAHIHNLFPLHSLSVLFALKSLRIPIVLTLHNYRYFFNKNNLYFWSNIYYMFTVIVLDLARVAGIFSLIDMFVVPSEHMLQAAMSAGIPRNKVTYIPHSLNEDNTMKERVKARKTFLYLGRLSHEKGIDRLYNFFYCHSQYNLVICTPDQSSSRHQKWSSVNNIIVYENLPKLVRDKIMRYVTALIVPSRWEEPFGLVVLEAMQQGTVPIVTSKGALPELVSDGTTGFVLNDTKNTFERELLDVIELLVCNPNLVRKIGSTAQRNAQAIYSSSEHLPKIIETYQKVQR